MEKVYDYGGDDWAEFIAAMHSGKTVEITADMFDYWLEVLPPVYMNRRIVLAGKERLCFGFAEGAETITAFWHEKGRYFCQGTDEVNR